MVSESKARMAHDTILSVLLREVDVPELQEPEYMNNLNVAGGVLCWVLEHDHNDSFQTNLDNIIQCLKDHGYKPMVDENQAPIPKVYPAVEYNKALRDAEALIVDKILIANGNDREILCNVMDEIKKLRK